METSRTGFASGVIERTLAANSLECATKRLVQGPMLRQAFLFACLVAGCSSAGDDVTPALDSSTDTAILIPDDSSAEIQTTEAAPADSLAETSVGDVAPALDAPASCGKREQRCCEGDTCETGMLCDTSFPSVGPICLCDTSLCKTNGWTCDGDQQVLCKQAAPGACPRPVSTTKCASGTTCSTTTGTCGGCDPHDECTGKADGTFLGCAPYTAIWCRTTDGCVKRTTEQCGIACVGGAREGCCGGEGQMCCNPPGAACASGLSCKNAVCAP